MSELTKKQKLALCLERGTTGLAAAKAQHEATGRYVINAEGWPDFIQQFFANVRLMSGQNDITYTEPDGTKVVVKCLGTIEDKVKRATKG